jgi:hypothetical protein
LIPFIKYSAFAVINAKKPHRQTSMAVTNTPLAKARQKGRRYRNLPSKVAKSYRPARKNICENEAVSIPTYGQSPNTVMAVAPDFHTDFLTVGAERPALSPTAPSKRGGIILRSGIFYHASGKMSSGNIDSR